MAKDVDYAIAEARAQGLNLPTAGAALTVFKQAMAAGYADKDFTSVAELLTAKHESLSS